MKVIGFFGPSGSGKTILANMMPFEYMLRQSKRVTVVSLATPIKRDLLHRFGIPPQKGKLLSPVRFGTQTATTYQEACQFYADMMREIDPECFLRELWNTVSRLEQAKADVVIVDGLRLEREVEDFHNNEAEVVLIRRPEMLPCTVPANAHPTERYALESAQKSECKLWTTFDNDQSLDSSAHSLYATIRNI
jgi:molybdopterin-guanine dinucleotide biosynthesis protein